MTNYIIPGSVSPPSLSVAKSISDIANYKNQDLGLIHATTLHKLRTVTSFSQLRFHCHKATVGRTVHIITALNATGFAVVDYFTSLSKPVPLACGSFYMGHGDDSMMSKLCSAWGPGGIGKWNHEANVPKEEKMNAPFYVQGLYHFYVETGRPECDDYEKPISAGDFWKIYVR